MIGRQVSHFHIIRTIGTGGMGVVYEAPDTRLPRSVAITCYVSIYAGLGERERALEHQEKAYADGASPFNYLFPGVRALYARSPHHQKRLEQMRLIL